MPLWKFESEKLAVAQELGYSTIRECILGEYEKHKNQYVVADIMDVTQAAISCRLRSWGVCCKINRGKHSRFERKDRELKTSKELIMKTIHKIEQGDLTRTQAAKRLNVHYTTILRYMRRFNNDPKQKCSDTSFQT